MTFPCLAEISLVAVKSRFLTGKEKHRTYARSSSLGLEAKSSKGSRGWSEITSDRGVFDEITFSSDHISLA